MFDDLMREIDEIAGADPHALACGEALVALHRAAQKLDAATARVTAAFDADKAWAASNARNAAAWLQATCHLHKRDARRQVRLGRALRHMPVVEEAWLAGDIDRAHVDTLNRRRRPSVKALFARDEAELVDAARTLPFTRFEQVLQRWHDTVAPDDAETRSSSQRDDRAVHLPQSYEGMWLGDLTLDPISGTIVADELRRLDKALFEADWAAAKHRLGRDPTLDELGRTPAQRRADALVEMATRSRTAPPGGRRPVPLFTVLVGYETFAGRVCELANRAPIAPGALVPWLTDAEVERVVFDGPNRVLEVGARRRLFHGALRRAIEVRDRECYHPMCDEPAQHCHTDHIEPYAAGGDTIQHNGRPACAYHNRQRHKRPPPDPDNDADDDERDETEREPGAPRDADEPGASEPG
jgi:hypothetical protein